MFLPLITSENNHYVRRVRALLRSTRRRYKESAMVVEGVRLCEELVVSSCAVERVFCSDSFSQSPDHQALLARCENKTILQRVSDSVFEVMSDTETPQGMLALAPIPRLSCTGKNRLVLIPDLVRDPGNLGTLLRSAWATGVCEVLIPPGTVDFTNPKVVRSGMGAHFHVPVRNASWDEILSEYGNSLVWIADAAGDLAYSRVNFAQDAVIIIGGEAEGASTQARSWGTPITIPMMAGVESLNAAVAGSVILFEAFRQRTN